MTLPENNPTTASTPTVASNDPQGHCAVVPGSAKTVPCPECYGGHFRPCQICGDSGWIEVVQGQVHACDCKRKFTHLNRNNHLPHKPNAPREPMRSPQP